MIRRTFLRLLGLTPLGALLPKVSKLRHPGRAKHRCNGHCPVCDNVWDAFGPEWSPEGFAHAERWLIENRPWPTISAVQEPTFHGWRLGPEMSWTDEEIERPLTLEERADLRERYPDLEGCSEGMFSDHHECGPGCYFSPRYEGEKRVE
jgi:hypothetical protein